MTASITTPFPLFTDDDGQPLDAGYIYIGTANLEPAANPVSIFWDAALTIPATQPVRTLGGYASNSGAPGTLYTSTDFSITVKDRNGVTLYTAPSYTFRVNSAAITFGAVIVDTSIVPDAAGGAFNGAIALPWLNTVTQGLQAKTATIYNQAQPASAADMAALNQRQLPVMIGRQTSVGAVGSFANIYNVNTALSNRVSIGRYDIQPTIAMPATFSVLLTNTVDVATIDLIVFSRSTTSIVVKTYSGGALTDIAFDFIVFGNPAVADPIS